MFETLKAIRAGQGDRHILSLFEAAPDRADNFSVEAMDLRFDYSKTQIDAEVRAALIRLCDDNGVAAARRAMFSGAPINETEGRAVLHTALRNLDGPPVLVQETDVMPGVMETLKRMRAFADRVRDSAITDVVNIGIGGSDLGPAMAVRALAPFHDGPRSHFVSNVDGADTIACADLMRQKRCSLWPRKPLPRSRP
jgi:glucose-6-phosphate isomerase